MKRSNVSVTEIQVPKKAIISSSKHTSEKTIISPSKCMSDDDDDPGDEKSAKFDPCDEESAKFDPNEKSTKWGNY